MQNAKKVSTKYSTFTSILVLALTSVIAQPNLYFQNNPVWQVSSSCAVPAPCIQEESKNYFLNGDTTINSYTFKKVYKKGQGFYNWMAPPPIGCTGSYWFIDTIPTYFLRSIGKQIYLRQPSDTSEYLLYDFDLSIGLRCQLHLIIRKIIFMFQE